MDSYSDDYPLFLFESLHIQCPYYNPHHLCSHLGTIECPASGTYITKNIAANYPFSRSYHRMVIKLFHRIRNFPNGYHITLR